MTKFSKVEVDPWDSKQLVALFRTVSKGEVSLRLKNSPKASMHNLKILAGFSQNTVVF